MDFRVTNTVRFFGTLGVVLGISSCSSLFGSMAKQTTDAAAPLASNPDAPSAEPAPEETDTSAAASPSTDPVSEATQKEDRDYFRAGVNRASSAVAIGQTAQSPDDWNLAVNRWRQAVDLLEQVPTDSPDHRRAQAKIQEYRNHLAAAQRRLDDKPAPPQQANPSRPDDLVAQIPIQERRGGTPVVSVTMKGQNSTVTFPMLFDTGATGTLITQEMANALGVVVVDQTQAKIADGSVVTLPSGYLTSMEAGGLRKEGLLVAIGGSVGLLGQDFYGEYGIAMGAQVINLHE